MVKQLYYSEIRTFEKHRNLFVIRKTSKSICLSYIHVINGGRVTNYIKWSSGCFVT